MNFKNNPLPLTIGIGVLLMIGVHFFTPEQAFASWVLVAICIVQNTSFSLVSRARNRDNQLYHATASVFSNGVWLLTMGYMINELNFEYWIIVPYVVGTVNGSLVGAKLSMIIERLIGATSDGHITPKKDKFTILEERLTALECAGLLTTDEQLHN